MAEVIGVRFKNTGKVYYFDPQGIQVEKGSMAIVETARGLECGEVALANREVADESIVQPLRRLIRLFEKGGRKPHQGEKGLSGLREEDCRAGPGDEAGGCGVHL